MKHQLLIMAIWLVTASIALSSESRGEQKIAVPEILSGAPAERMILQGGDTFTEACVIDSIPFYATGTTVGYTNNYDAICPYDSSIAPDVVYRYTAAMSAGIDIGLCRGSNFDTKLYVFMEPDTINPIACNDDACSTPYFPQGYVSQIVDLSLLSGATYFFVVDGYGECAGNYTFDISVGGPCGEANLPFFNGMPDDEGFLPAMRLVDADNNSWVIDDMVFEHPVNIWAFHWFVACEAPYAWAGTADLIVLADNEGAPADTLGMMQSVPVTREATGRSPLGRAEYIYSIGNLHVNLLPGSYWLGLRPTGYDGFRSYWSTSQGQGGHVYVDYPPDHPAWTPGSQVFGADYDVAFCASGAFACDYVIGDLNNSGMADGMDVVYGVNFMKGGAAPPDSCDCPPLTYPFYAAGDANGNCAFNGIDLTYFVAYLKGLQESLRGCYRCPAVRAR